MKILRYWKTVEIGVGKLTFYIVPVQTVTQDHALFDKIVEAVKVCGFSYSLSEETEIERGEGNIKEPSEHGPSRQPYGCGAFVNDLFYGDQADSTKATHRWDGYSWRQIKLL